ncbi:MAG: DUF5615 family PIN-like protein [Acidimicrobiales bacterium]
MLLDENFPIQLYRRLQEVGHDAEHIIVLGLRCLPDTEIRHRLAIEANLVFPTRDTEFSELPAATVATVMISRVPQAIPVAERVDMWLHAIDDFLQHPIPGRLVEVLADGRVVAWRTQDL